jgi:hypothetical protein
MRQVVAADRIFQGCGNMLLAHNGVEGLRAVFTGGNNKLLHAERSSKQAFSASGKCTVSAASGINKLYTPEVKSKKQNFFKCPYACPFLLCSLLPLKLT